MQKETYVCAICKRMKTKGWSDQEALAEYEATFVPDDEPTSIVCDDCYPDIMAWVMANMPGSLR